MREAYLCGLVAGDGCLTIGYGKQILELMTADEQHLEVMKTLAPWKGPYKNKNCWLLRTHDEGTIAKLANRNLARPKNPFYHLETGEFPHWLRGFFETDGCIAANGKQLTLVQKEFETLEWIRHELEWRGIESKIYDARKNCGTYHLSTWKATGDLARLMYEDSGPLFMERKRERLRAYL